MKVITPSYGHGPDRNELEQLLAFVSAWPAPEFKAMTVEEILAEVDAEM